jgi:hypothetical protein
VLGLAGVAAAPLMLASGIVGGVSQGAASAARALSGSEGGSGGLDAAAVAAAARLNGGSVADARGGFGSSGGGGGAAGAPTQRRRPPRALYGPGLSLRAFDGGDALLVQNLRATGDRNVARELSRFPLVLHASARLARGARLLLLPGHVVRLEQGQAGATMIPSLLKPLRDVGSLETVIEGERELLLVHLRSQERELVLELAEWGAAEELVAVFEASRAVSRV